MDRLDLATQTLFAEFAEAVRARAALEAALATSTMYVKKRVKGHVYWYTQRSQLGTQQQVYVGRETDALRASIEQQRSGRKTLLTRLQRMRMTEARHAAMLAKAGLPRLDPRMAFLLGQLSRVGLCYRHGVLVGSLACMTYVGVLGSPVEQALLRTLDIDLVRDSRLVDAAMPVVELSALGTRDESFQPLPGLDPRALPASFIGPGNIRIDLLTPQRGRPHGVRKAPGIRDAGLQPLPFLDFLIAETIDTVLLAPRGGIPVTVPTPVRYAIHKAIVATRRNAGETAKREKDLAQSARLIALCREIFPIELQAAYKEACAHGPQWRRALKNLLPPS